MNEALTLRTLDDGGKSPEEVAGMIADFLGSARATLDLAQYDFNLQPRTAEIVGGAIAEFRGKELIQGEPEIRSRCRRRPSRTCS